MTEKSRSPQIVLGLAGEGRGHATRALTLIRQIGDAYRFRVLTSHDAFRFLEPLVANLAHVKIEEIPGLKFYYRRGQLDLWRSTCMGLGYLCHLRRRSKRLAEQFRCDPPALVISDFESTVSWAAWFANVPLASVDHQHFLVAYDLSCLPRRLRCWAAAMSVIVRAHHTWQRKTIVSSFFREPLKRGCEGVVQVGPLIRRAILEQTPVVGDYMLSYVRPETAKRMLTTLLALGRPVKVYGLRALPARGQLTFHDLHPDRFVEDLAGASAVVGAAGNQLIGEALFLGKPYFAIPESAHHEQLINAFFVKRMGVGDACEIDRLQVSLLGQFSECLEEYRDTINRHHKLLNGTPIAVEVLRQMLPSSDVSARVTE